jgi:hypothetical protein
MGINTHLGKVVPGLAAVTSVFSCSTGNGTHASGAAINGNIIDRLGLKNSHLPQGQTYNVAESFVTVFTTIGSTFVNKRLSITSKLQTGDSSGGGDMADMITAASTAPSAAVNYWSSAMTTDYTNYTTGLLTAGAMSPSYELGQFARRYLRPVGIVTTPGNSTATSGGDIWYVNMGVRFAEPWSSPPFITTTSATTST